MKKVYLVTAGDKSEHSVSFYVKGVFSNRKTAEKFLHQTGDYDMSVTEMTVDDPLEDGWNSYLMINFVD